MQGFSQRKPGARWEGLHVDPRALASSRLITGRAVAELNWSWKTSVSNYCQKHKIYKAVSSQLGDVTESN